VADAPFDNCPVFRSGGLYEGVGEGAGQVCDIVDRSVTRVSVPVGSVRLKVNRSW